MRLTSRLAAFSLVASALTPAATGLASQGGLPGGAAQAVIEVRGCKGEAALATVVGASGEALYLVTAGAAVTLPPSAPGAEPRACADLKILPPGAFEGLPASLAAVGEGGALAILQIDTPVDADWSAARLLLPAPVADGPAMAAAAGAEPWAPPPPRDGRPRRGWPGFDAAGALLRVSLDGASPAGVDASEAVATGPQVREALARVPALGALPPLSEGLDLAIAAPRGETAAEIAGVVGRALGGRDGLTVGALSQPLRGEGPRARQLEARRLAAMVRARRVVEVRPVGADDGARWQVEIVSDGLVPAPADVDAARILGGGLDGARLRAGSPGQAGEEAVALARAFAAAGEALGLPRDDPRRDELLTLAAVHLDAPLRAREDALLSIPPARQGDDALADVISLDLVRAALLWHKSQGLPLVAGRDAEIQASLDDAAAPLNQAVSHFDALVRRRPLSPAEARALAAVRHDLAVIEVTRPGGRADAGLVRDEIVAAIQAFPRSWDPKAWATAQRTLGEALTSPPERWDEAQAALAAALDVRTRQRSPALWAEATILMAEARQGAGGGDKASLHKAIAGFEEAAAALDPSIYRCLWARAHLGLAEARTELPFEDEGQQIERALTDLSGVLGVLSPRFFPRAWALAWTTLGYAYQVRTQGPRGERFDQAIDAYRQALRIYDEQETPLEWAWTWTNLGTAYLGRPYGDPDENIDEALAAYDLAETVFARTGRPELLATALNNRGNAHLLRFGGDREENLVEAKRLFAEALALLPEAIYPEDHAQTAANLEIADAYLAAWLLKQHNPGTAREIEALGDAYLLEGLEYRAWILLTRREDRFQQAVDCYRAAISRQPQAAIHHHKLSVALWKLGDLDGAIAAQDDAVELEPDNPFIANWRRFLTAQRYLLLDPDSIKGWMTLAEFHLEADELPEAVSTYKKVTQLDPHTTEAWIQLVRIFMSQGDAEAARRAAEAGLSANPEAFELLAMAHGICHEYLFDFEAARGYAERMAAQGEGDVDLQVTLMEALLTSGDGLRLREIGRAVLKGDGLEEDVEVVARTLLYLEALTRGRGRREARRLEKAYAAVPDGAPARWTWQGTRRWAQTRIPPGERQDAALGVLDLLSGDKPAGGDAALKALVE